MIVRIVPIVPVVSKINFQDDWDDWHDYRFPYDCLDRFKYLRHAVISDTSEFWHDIREQNGSLVA